MKKTYLILLAVLCTFFVVSCSQTIEVTTYTVTFDANGIEGATMPADQTVLEGTTATVPKDPVMPEGKVFAGWYKKASCTTEFDFDAVITEDTVIYASSTDAAPAPVEGSGYFSSNINEFLNHYGELKDLPQSLSTEESLITPFVISGDVYTFLNNNEVDYLEGSSHIELTVDLAPGEIKDFYNQPITTLTDVMQGTIIIDWSLNPATPTDSVYTVSYKGTFEAETFEDYTQLTTGTCSLFDYSINWEEMSNLAYSNFSGAKAEVNNERFKAILLNQLYATTGSPNYCLENCTSKGTYSRKCKLNGDYDNYTSETSFESTSEYVVNEYASSAGDHWIVNIVKDTGSVQADVQILCHTEPNYGMPSIMLNLATVKINGGEEYKYIPTTD